MKYAIAVCLFFCYAGAIKAPAQQGDHPEAVVQTSSGIQNGEVVIGPGNRWIAERANGGRISIYELKTGRLARVLKTEFEETGSADTAHPVKDLLATSGSSGVALFNVVTGLAVWRHDTSDACSQLVFNKDGSLLYGICSRTLAVGQVETSLVTLDGQTGHEVSSRTLGKSGAHLSPDGEWYATSEVHLLRGAFRNFGKRLATPYGVFSSTIVETGTGTEIGHVEGSVLALSPKQPRGLVATGKEIVVVDFVTGKRQILLENSIVSGEFSADGSLVMLTYPTMRVIDTKTGKEYKLNPGLQLGIGQAALSSDNELLAKSKTGSGLVIGKLSDPGSIRYLGAGTGQPGPWDDYKIPSPDEAIRMQKAKGAEKARLQAEYNQTIRNGFNDGNKLEEQRAAEKILGYYQRFGNGVAFPPLAAFSKNGDFLIVRSADLGLNAWDVATGNHMPYREPPLSAASLSGLTNDNMRALLSAADLEKFEGRLTGQPEATQQVPEVQTTSSPKPFQARGDIGCSSGDGKYLVELTWEKKHLRGATLHSLVDDHSVNLLELGLDLSAFEAARPHRDLGDLGEGSFGRPPLCALSNKGEYVVYEVTDPGAAAHSKVGNSIFRMRPEDMQWKSTADNLAIVELPSGKEVTRLEKPPGRTDFDLTAGNLRFSPDDQLLLSSRDRKNYEYDDKRSHDVHVWDVRSGKLKNEVKAASLKGFSPDAGWYATTNGQAEMGSVGYGIQFWDKITHKSLFSIPDVVAEIDALTTNPSRTVVIGPERNNALGFWSAKDGRQLGSLHALQEGEWLVTTPEGLFDGSPRGWTQFSWRNSNQELTTSPGEIFFNEYYRPGLLADLIAGRSVPPPRNIAQIDRRQPVVVIETVSGGKAGTATLRISVTEATAGGSANGSGARDLRLFRNSVLVKAWHGDLALQKGKAVLEATVPAVAGQNRFVAYAFNHDNVKSADASVMLVGGMDPRRGIAYILAVGINRYQNHEFDLKWARPDAEKIAEALGRSEKQVGEYEKIVTIPILDSDATRENILRLLERLGGRSNSPPASERWADLQAARPEDSVVIYFAGHGFAAGDRFYLVPHDLGYAGARRDLADSMDQVIRRSISDLDLQAAFEPIDAGHILLIVDACNAGKALDSDDERRGPMNSKGLAQLAYEKGMDILTAAQAYQAALESSRLGHGYLTYALVEEGLKDPIADTSPRDGRLTAEEWFEYASKRVPQLQIEAIRQAGAQGRLLTFELGKGEEAPASRLQTPRLYYRRDNTTAPMVVARY